MGKFIYQYNGQLFSSFKKYSYQGKKRQKCSLKEYCQMKEASVGRAACYMTPRIWHSGKGITEASKKIRGCQRFEERER